MLHCHYLFLFLLCHVCLQLCFCFPTYRRCCLCTAFLCAKVAIADFIRRDSGEPIALPAASLSPEESRATQMEAEAAVARITDEFRRYRVKAEVSRKQRDAEVRQAKHAAVAEQQRRIDGQGGGSISGGGGSGLDGSGGGSGGSNSRNALEEQLLTLQEESEVGLMLAL